MEIRLRKSQEEAKTRFKSTVIFVLHVQLQPTNEEMKLVDKYGNCLPLPHWIGSFDSDGPTKCYSIKDFIKGVTFKEQQIAAISDLEEKFKNLPDMITLHLKLARDFNGESIIKRDL